MFLESCYYAILRSESWSRSGSSWPSHVRAPLFRFVVFVFSFDSLCFTFLLVSLFLFFLGNGLSRLGSGLLL